MDPKNRFDKSAWRVTLLPSIKRHQYAQGRGFCGGFVAGSSSASHKEGAAWWPDGDPRPLTFGKYKELGVRDAEGSAIVGVWSAGGSGKCGAVLWTLREGGDLDEVELHHARYTKTYAMGVGGGAQVGFGQPKVKKGERAQDRALLWRGGGEPKELRTPDGEESSAEGTDGTCHVGRVSGWPALWPADDAAPVSLSPGDVRAAVTRVRDGEQVGSVWKGMVPKAALWKGTAESLVTLTPRGFEASKAMDCAQGFQVGFVKKHERTPGGASSMLCRAVLWNGSPEFIDLHEMLPEPWNGSVATRIEIVGDRLRICGAADHVVTHGPGLNASEGLAAKNAVVWEARLG